ncbi:transposase [Companilactobacillus huachuanensis]|uniref:Transposase n=1 Tax=Companilactobacillus huachuanensis TaxID=2559914 RepID=A0ABW1RMM3_9LACO|nr:helix-turn-helix domain-containing protein [Companilactobacillus huachuanensis]
MTKYSGSFKVDVVNEYNLEHASYKTLVKKYHITLAVIQRWVALADAQGLEALQGKHGHKTYSLEEKLAVVDYYQTHEQGVFKVGAKFNLNPSQVTAWTKIFMKHGAAGLRPKRKGRPSTVPKKNMEKGVKKLEPTEKEKLLQENMQLRAALHEAQLERDF